MKNRIVFCALFFMVVTETMAHVPYERGIGFILFTGSFALFAGTVFTHAFSMFHEKTLAVSLVALNVLVMLVLFCISLGCWYVCILAIYEYCTWGNYIADMLIRFSMLIVPPILFGFVFVLTSNLAKLHWPRRKSKVFPDILDHQM